MHRTIVPTILLAALLLSGCATLDGMFERPAPSRANYGGYSSSRSSVAPSREYDPKTSPYTVMGKRYYPLRNAAGYDEVGVASWYGTDFHGKATASGDTYNMYSMTAAHKTLPLGTIVRVTNLGNGRQVNLLVNDRGPFVGTRLIDLSYAAARALGSAPAQTASAGGYDVQVGAFRDADNADRVLRHLRSKGFSGAHIAEISSGSGTLHLVRVRLSDKSQARRTLEQVRVYYPSSFIAS